MAVLLKNSAATASSANRRRPTESFIGGFSFLLKRAQPSTFLKMLICVIPTELNLKKSLPTQHIPIDTRNNHAKTATLLWKSFRKDEQELLNEFGFGRVFGLHRPAPFTLLDDVPE